MSKPVAGTLPVKAYRANPFPSETRYLASADVEIADPVTRLAVLAHLREQGWEGEWIARLLDENLRLTERVERLERLASATGAVVGSGLTDGAQPPNTHAFAGVSG